MSAFDPGKNGTLAILDNLPTDVRDRYIDTLPEDTLRMIVRALCEEKDARKTGNKGQAITSEQVQMGSTTILTLRNKVADSQRSLKVITPPATLEDTEDVKRPWPFLDTPETSPMLFQRQTTTSSSIDVEATLSPSAPVSDPKETCKQGNPLMNDSSLLASSATSQTVSIQLPILLHVPEADGRIGVVTIEKLPVAVGKELKHRFWTLLNNTKTRQDSCRLFMKYLDRYLGRPRCVCDQIRVNMKLSRKGVPLAPQTFALGGKFGKSADDRCIKENVPCVHIIRHDGEYALCLVPLPEAMRSGEHWKDLTYWVQK